MCLSRVIYFWSGIFCCYCDLVLSMYDLLCFVFFKQKTAYEMRISDWSSDVCSSDLGRSDIGGFSRFSMFLAPCDTPRAASCKGGGWSQFGFGEIGRASCRERVCQYV